MATNSNKKKRSTAKSWKKSSGDDQGVMAADVELPSGNIALIRRVGPELLLQDGMIPDPLSTIVEKAIKSKKGIPPEKLLAMTEDPKQLGDMFQMLDQILCRAVVEPRVLMPPPCNVLLPTGEKDEEDEQVMKACSRYFTDSSGIHTDPTHEYYHGYQEGPRDSEVLYADQVDLEDKLFVMNYTIGGTKDLERFREEQQSAVAAISAGEGMALPTE